MEFGVNPACMENMSLGQLIGMNRELKARQKGRSDDTPMSDEDFDALKDYVRGLNMPDVKI